MLNRVNDRLDSSQREHGERAGDGDAIYRVN